MKKVLASLLLLTAVTYASSAFAGTNNSTSASTNNDLSEPKNGADLKGKEKSTKYSFTLFNFFASQSVSKDTTSTSEDPKQREKLTQEIR